MIIRAKAVSEVSSCLRPSVPAVPKKSQSVVHYIIVVYLIIVADHIVLISCGQ